MKPIEVKVGMSVLSSLRLKAASENSQISDDLEITTITSEHHR